MRNPIGISDKYKNKPFNCDSNILNQTYIRDKSVVCVWCPNDLRQSNLIAASEDGSEQDRISGLGFVKTTTAPGLFGFNTEHGSGNSFLNTSVDKDVDAQSWVLPEATVSLSFLPGSAFQEVTLFVIGYHFSSTQGADRLAFSACGFALGYRANTNELILRIGTSALRVPIKNGLSFEDNVAHMYSASYRPSSDTSRILSCFDGVIHHDAPGFSTGMTNPGFITLGGFGNPGARGWHGALFFAMAFAVFFEEKDHVALHQNPYEVMWANRRERHDKTKPVIQQKVTLGDGIDLDPYTGAGIDVSPVTTSDLDIEKQTTMDLDVENQVQGNLDVEKQVQSDLNVDQTVSASLEVS